MRPSAVFSCALGDPARTQQLKQKLGIVALAINPSTPGNRDRKLSVSSSPAWSRTTKRGPISKQINNKKPNKIITKNFFFLRFVMVNVWVWVDECVKCDLYRHHRGVGGVCPLEWKIEVFVICLIGYRVL